MTTQCDLVVKIDFTHASDLSWIPGAGRKKGKWPQIGDQWIGYDDTRSLAIKVKFEQML